MKSIIKQNPFFSICLISTILFFTMTFLPLEYDSAGVSGYLFWIQQIFGFNIWWPSEILFSLNNGVAISYHTTISTIIGLSTSIAFDFIYGIIFRKKLK